MKKGSFRVPEWTAKRCRVQLTWMLLWTLKEWKYWLIKLFDDLEPKCQYNDEHANSAISKCYSRCSGSSAANSTLFWIVLSELPAVPSGQ